MVGSLFLPRVDSIVGSAWQHEPYVMAYLLSTRSTLYSALYNTLLKSPVWGLSPHFLLDEKRTSIVTALQMRFPIEERSLRIQPSCRLPSFC